MNIPETLPATPESLEQLSVTAHELIVRTNDSFTEDRMGISTASFSIEGLALHERVPKAAEDLRIFRGFTCKVEQSRSDTRLHPADFTWDILPATGFDYHLISILPPLSAESKKWRQINWLRLSSADPTKGLERLDAAAFDFELFEQHSQELDYVYTYEAVALQSIVDMLQSLPDDELGALRIPDA